MNIKGKVAIVTGASSGIGEATARLLSEKGASVALVARSKEILEKISGDLPNSKVFPANMSDFGQVRDMVKEVKKAFGSVDILINCAGRGYHVPVLSIDPVKYHELFDLDVLGPLVAMQEVVPIMKKEGGGSIINISSGTSLMAIPGIGAYSSAKRALNAISLTAASELEEDNIKVSVVYPYITKTNFHKNLIGGGEWDMDESDDLPEFDEPEIVAKKILEAVETGAKEVYVHDWMKGRK
ncbi:MAG TPA: SDR family oxidoreductase [Patescibacteria group bacterium]|nr:SDR family oxidoreductase [Patescibacteria group bacterium]